MSNRLGSRRVGSSAKTFAGFVRVLQFSARVRWDLTGVTAGLSTTTCVEEVVSSDDTLRVTNLFVRTSTDIASD